MSAESQTTALWNSYKSVLRARQKVIIVAVLISIVICAALQNSGSIESLENQIGRPTFFYIRDRLGLAPKLDPRILIYAYDDAAVREWGRPELLSGKQWGEIMGAITDHGPKTVFVDMIFGNPRKDPNDVAAMNRAFKRSVPIYTSAWRNGLFPTSPVWTCGFICVPGPSRPCISSRFAAIPHASRIFSRPANHDTSRV